MAKRIRTFSPGRSINALVEHLIEVVVDCDRTLDPEMIRRGVMEIAAVLATKYPDPRAQRDYLEMISDSLGFLIDEAAAKGFRSAEWEAVAPAA